MINKILGYFLVYILEMTTLLISRRLNFLQCPIQYTDNLDETQIFNIIIWLEKKILLKSTNPNFFEFSSSWRKEALINYLKPLGYIAVLYFFNFCGCFFFF
jgi:hypothetical protein